MQSKFFSLFLLLSLALTVVAQPVIISTTGAGAEAYSIPPSFQDYSSEQVVLSVVGREIFSRTSVEELMQSCSEPDGIQKITDEVEKILDESGFEYSNICTSLDTGLRAADIGDSYCENLKVERSASCPPSEDKLVALCRKRLENEKKYSDVEEDDAVWCNNQFQQNKKQLERYCRGGKIDLSGKCPVLPLGDWQSTCRQKGGVPSTEVSANGCEVPRCDFEGFRPPVIIDSDACPPVPIGMDEMCRRTGGVPTVELRGLCKVPRCDFANTGPTNTRICPAIALPPNWQESCRARGGVPIPDDTYGCPRGDCRMPGSCPAVPLLSSVSCGPGQERASGVDPAGCSYSYCKPVGGEERPVSPCPEISPEWYNQCRQSGGTPQITSDPYRPACMQFACPGAGNAGTCPSEAQNADASKQCIARGGSIYYNYGSGGCKIVSCYESATPQNCPSDPFTETRAIQCRDSGGIVSNSYSSGCSYRYCYFAPKQSCSAPSLTCPTGQSRRISGYSGSCPTYSCESLTCPVPPVCGPGQVAKPTGKDLSACTLYSCSSADVGGCPGPHQCTDGSYATSTGYTSTSSSGLTCPVYQCSAASTGEACPPSTAPSGCTAGTVPNTYSYTAPSGKQLSCTSYTCASTPGTNYTVPATCSPPPACSSGMVPQSTSSAGGCQVYTCVASSSSSGTSITCPSSTTPSCPGGSLTSSYYNYSISSGWKMCQSQTCGYSGSTGTGSNGTSSGSGSYGTCPTMPSCPSGQYAYSNPTPASSGTSWSCPTYTCVPNTCNCPASTGPGATTCPSGQVSSWTTEPYSCGSTTIQCSKSVCKTIPKCSGGCPGTTTCSAGMVVKTGTPYSSNYNGQECYCESTWCETDYTNVPACTSSCPSQPTCGADQIVKTGGYSTYQENGKQCKCESKWCETDPTKCASVTCPQSTSTTCGPGQIQRTSTSPYYPPGCSSNPIQCTTTWCETDQSQCASQTCPTTSPYVPPTSCTGTVRSSSTSYYPPGCSSTSVQCQNYWCDTTNATQRGFIGTGFAVGVGVFGDVNSVVGSPAPQPTNSLGPCTETGDVNRESFMRECLSSRRVYSFASYESGNIESICKQEVALTLPKMRDFCTRAEDPYDACKQRAKETKSKYSTAYSKCSSLANKEKVLELVKAKAKTECKRRQLNIDLFASTGGDLTGVEETHVGLVQDSAVLTTADIERIREETRKDVLTGLSGLLGARADQEREEARRKLVLADKLASVAESVRGICSKVQDESCNAAVAQLERQSADLRGEAQNQLMFSGGVIQGILNLLSGNVPEAVPTPVVTRSEEAVTGAEGELISVTEISAEAVTGNNTGESVSVTATSRQAVTGNVPNSEPVVTPGNET